MVERVVLENGANDFHQTLFIGPLLAEPAFEKKFEKVSATWGRQTAFFSRARQVHLMTILMISLEPP